MAAKKKAATAVESAWVTEKKASALAPRTAGAARRSAGSTGTVTKRSGGTARAPDTAEKSVGAAGKKRTASAERAASRKKAASGTKASSAKKAASAEKAVRAENARPSTKAASSTKAPAEKAASGRSANASAARSGSGSARTGKKTAGPAADKGDKAAASAAARHTGKKTAAKKAAVAKRTGAKKVATKKTVAGTAAPMEPPIPTVRAAAAPEELAVRPGEEPWTADEVEKARTGLEEEVLRLRAEIAASEASVAGLLRDSGDGAGDDQADTGAKNITREHEMSLAANAREMQIQTEHALERLATGTYGLCESCGKAIGKARMQAFPRATLCVECKQKQERR
jgi:RNA polymerase-binding transcription factor DksA